MRRALEGAIRQFRTREELWPLRAPAEPLILDDIIDRALAGEAGRFDPLRLRARSLIRLSWTDGAFWELWTIVLDNGVKLYCDSNGEESRVLASARRDSEIDPDRLFLELLSESAGEIFGIEMTGGPPAKVRSSLERAQLTDFFVHLFEVGGMEEDIRAAGATSEADRGRCEAARTDFERDVQRWLDHALR